MIRVELPWQLRTLARLDRAEVQLPLVPPVTIGTVLDALEARHPVLRGAIRMHGSLARRPMLRYFAAGEDLSFHPHDHPLPAAVARGDEPFIVLGAIAGG
ncbi:MAG: MoaD/ThiS family protein [Gemmatimonadales bacterium]|jgi:hypothetical protein|nr:MoaD/ThiS family protein [Gemmatimonadales bacterium]